MELDLAPGLGRWPEIVELSIFRVAQESLANVHRHSKSASARLRLAKEHGEVVLEVRDAGRGLPAESVCQHGVGIAGMRERIAQAGGSLAIESSPRGTTVTARIPVS